MSTPLTYTLEGTTAVLRMDDGKANALSEAMIDALVEAIGRAEKEASAAVLVGRPYIFGLANAGAQGVAHVIRLLRDELEIAMALCGVATLDTLPDGLLI